MVGIGSGAPNIDDGRDIRLGDVVISKPENKSGGMIQLSLVLSRNPS
jgi:hypothetical protein